MMGMFDGCSDNLKKMIKCIFFYNYIIKYL